MDPLEPFIPEGLDDLTLPKKPEKSAENKVVFNDELKTHVDRRED